MKNQRCLTAFLFLAIFTLCSSQTLVAAPADNDGAVASAKVSTAEINWQPKVEYASIVLTVSTPDGEVLRQEFVPGEALVFRATTDKGVRRPDGQYTYEMRVMPVIAQETKDALVAARAQGKSEEVARTMRSRGAMPSGETVQSGAFRISGGKIVMGGQVEGEKTGVSTKTASNLYNLQPSRAASGFRLLPVAKRASGFLPVNSPILSSPMRPFDQVIADDLIVQMSLCVGVDCVNNESFGFDTIRLKENNLRIKFEDTSTGSFPSNDWELTANDSANGGLNRFSITDVTNSKTPFTVEANAPTNSLYVDDGGRIGMGTSTPVLPAHMVNGNTPALRLEQNGSSGFTAQTWDVAGNEANFFVRDVTNSSHLPFRIVPGAPTDSIIIKSDGKVGMGIFNPEQRLHVFGNMVVEGSIDVRDNSFGSLLKQPLDTKLVLEQLATISLFKTEGDAANASRLGLNIKELNAAFGLGNKDKISLMEINAISLAAIKAVYVRLQDKDAEIARLRTENLNLQQRLGEMERRLEAVESYLTSQRKQ